MKPPIEPEESKIAIPEVKNGLDALTGTMPEVVPDAVNAAKAQETEQQNKLNDYVDSAGTHFDPNKHSTDADGNPKISSITGKLKLKPGVKFGGKKEASFINLQPAEKQEDPQKQKIHAAAVQFADSFIAAGVMIVGEEWKDDKGERDTLIDANERIFERYGVVEVHPIANVTLVYGLYIFKRVMKPQSKAQMIFNYVMKKTKEMFGKMGDWVKYTIFHRPRPSISKPIQKKEDNAKDFSGTHK